MPLLLLFSVEGLICLAWDAGTDTMAYTASALSLMLLGFRKPIVVTGQRLSSHFCLHNVSPGLHHQLCCAT